MRTKTSPRYIRVAPPLMYNFFSYKEKKSQKVLAWTLTDAIEKYIRSREGDGVTHLEMIRNRFYNVKSLLKTIDKVMVTKDRNYKQ